MIGPEALSGQGLLNGTVTRLANFFGGEPTNRSGIRVAVKNLDGDNRADLVLGPGSSAGSEITAYAGRTMTPATTPPVLRTIDAFPGFTGGVVMG